MNQARKDDIVQLKLLSKFKKLKCCINCKWYRRADPDGWNNVDQCNHKKMFLICVPPHGKCKYYRSPK